MPVSPEWFCGVFLEESSVNMVIIDKLGTLKHAQKVEAKGAIEQMKSVKAEIHSALGKKGVSKTAISLAVPTTSFQMFVDSESLDLEYLEWKSSMYAGNMSSRLISNEVKAPFSTASLRSEELLPWKDAIKKTGLWVCSIEGQQSAVLNSIEGLGEFANQKVNLFYTNEDTFVIRKSENNWKSWNHIDMEDLSLVSEISSESDVVCLYTGAENSNINSLSNVKALDSYFEAGTQKEALLGCFGVSWGLANRQKEAQ
jgi:hypothetical protein